MEATQRMIPLPEGKRAGIKLDQATWQAIDWLADHNGKTWQQWCAEVIQGTSEGENATAAVRAAAMASLLHETVFNDRAEQFSGIQPTGFRLAGTCDRKGLQEAIEQAVIEGTADLVSVEIMSGIDEHQRVAFYIKNKLADAPHMLISTPFTPMQWLDALDQ